MSQRPKSQHQNHQSRKLQTNINNRRKQCITRRAKESEGYVNKCCRECARRRVKAFTHDEEIAILTTRTRTAQSTATHRSKDSSSQNDRPAIAKTNELALAASSSKTKNTAVEHKCEKLLINDATQYQHGVHVNIAENINDMETTSALCDQSELDTVGNKGTQINA